MASPLFSTFLGLSKDFLNNLLEKGDSVLDATMGAGFDTLFLAERVLEKAKGWVFAFDIQKEALERTKEKLKESLSPELRERVSLFHQCHSSFPPEIQENSLKAIIYNLGYLPKSDKSFTSKTETTLKSVEQALPLLMEKGALFIHAYPGHPEGKKEEAALLLFLEKLPKKIFSVSHFRFLNREDSPSFFFIQKLK